MTVTNIESIIPDKYKTKANTHVSLSTHMVVSLADMSMPKELLAAILAPIASKCYQAPNVTRLFPRRGNSLVTLGR